MIKEFTDIVDIHHTKLFGIVISFKTTEKVCESFFFF